MGVDCVDEGTALGATPGGEVACPEASLRTKAASLVLGRDVEAAGPGGVLIWDTVGLVVALGETSGGLGAALWRPEDEWCRFR